MRFLKYLTIALLLAISTEQVQALARPAGKPVQKHSTPPAPAPPSSPSPSKKVIKKTTTTTTRRLAPTSTQRVIVHQQPVVVHQQPIVVHQQPVVVHQAPVVTPVYNAMNGYSMTNGICKLPNGLAGQPLNKAMRPDGLQPASALECQNACQIDPNCHSATFWATGQGCLVSRQPGLYKGDGTPNAYCYSKVSLQPAAPVAHPVTPAIVPVKAVAPVPEKQTSNTTGIIVGVVVFVVVVCIILLVCMSNKSDDEEEEIVEEVVTEHVIVQEYEEHFEGGEPEDRKGLLDYHIKQQRRKNAKNKGFPGHNSFINENI